MANATGIRECYTSIGQKMLETGPVYRHRQRCCVRGALVSVAKEVCDEELGVCGALKVAAALVGEDG
jgi:hypothetical protein